MIKLQKEDISLRALEPEDLSLLLAWENNPEFWTSSQQRAPYSEYLMKQYLLEVGKSPYEVGQLRMMICYKNQSIGLADFFDFDVDHRRGALGILIGAETNRGKGLAESALNLFIDYLFTAFDLQQLHVSIADGNVASLRLFEKCGFEKCGLRKQWYRQGDSFIDEHLLQLLKGSR